MNEITRCCRVLNVKPGASLEEVKEAYRDLVQVWHPDRFSEKERLQNRAQEQLKEINLAYEFLMAHGFQNGVLVDSTEENVIASQDAESATTRDSDSFQSTSAGGEPPFDSGEQSGQPGASRKTLWVIVGLIIILMVAATLLIVNARHRASVADANQRTNDTDFALTNPATIPASTAEINNAPENAFSQLYTFSNDVLGSNTETNQDGWLQSKYLMTPPFAIGLKLNLIDLVDFRVGFALGRLFFNYPDHPKELRIHEPRGRDAASVYERGLLLPKETHKIVWEVGTNKMSLSVDGQVCYETNGNFQGIKGFPCVKPYNGSVNLEQFVLETPRPLEGFVSESSERVPVAGDLLPTMVPDKDFQLTTEPGGIVLKSASESGKRLMTTNTFQPPFTIRVRAKTDAQNLRLFCGAGQVIFNWEMDFRELRVHDPLTGQQFGLQGRGIISPNDWHDIVWEVQRTGMRLLVDGFVRFANRKDYHTLNATVGIGQFRSKVTVDYFQVQK